MTITRRVRAGALHMLVATLALFAAVSCGSGSDDVVDPPTTDPELDADEEAIARGSRIARNPKGGRTLGQPGPITIVHALGSLAGIPDTAAWPEQLALVGEDQATLSALACTPADDGCGLGDFTALALGDLDAISLATVEVDAAGLDALAATAAALNDLDIGTPGYGRDVTRAVAPHLVLDGETTLAIHAITMVDGLVSEATRASPGIAGPTSLSPLLDAVALSATSGHVTIVLVGWPESGDRAPAAADIGVAEALVGAGADAVIGFGGATLERMERIESIPVVFDLGPAVNGSDPADTAIFRFVVGSSVEDSCLLPATAGPSGPSIDRPDQVRCRN